MEVPAKYKTGGTLMLVSGIYNIVFSLGLAAALFLNISAFAISTFGLGIVCYVCMCWPLLPFVMGVVELVHGVRVMGGTPVPMAKTVAIVGLVVGVLNFSVIPIIMEVIAMMSLNDDEVTKWLASHDQLPG
jgi:hypothetical protein